MINKNCNIIMHRDNTLSLFDRLKKAESMISFWSEKRGIESVEVQSWINTVESIILTLGAISDNLGILANKNPYSESAKNIRYQIYEIEDRIQAANTYIGYYKMN